MARILGVDGLTLQDVEQEVAAGARFVQFQYCISVILMIFRRGSNIYFVRVDDSVLARREL